MNSLFYLRALLVCLMIGFTLEVYSQKTAMTFQVKGTVKSEQGRNISGVAILVKGTNIGVLTNEDGEFDLSVPNEKSTLILSHFSSPVVKEFPIDGKSQVDILFSELNTEKDPNKTGYKVFYALDELPLPSSGEMNWNKYLAKSITYPLEAREKGDQGTVVLSFKVDAEGKVKNVEVLRGVSSVLDQEAVRAVSEGPEWTPGKLNGQIITSQVSMPIRFILQDEGEHNTPGKQREKAIADHYGEYLVVIGYPPVK
ncbi:energy transducer TonB [Algoriphagus mannitolivorans]|uniref:energy transducer TonB n=1 Tax=Algoriphagus mannitolivorans TaxID=226504 RepID=UPI0006881EEF|nr:energy transducer TonB [Algoriphagus mannitolivorans]